MKQKLLAFFAAGMLLVAGCKKDDVPGGSVNIDKRNVGASANEILSASKYTSLHIQIQYMPGFAPDPASITNLQNFLNTLINKPAGVTVSSTAIPASGKASVTISEIRAFETQYRNGGTAGTTLNVYVLYADAAYSTPNTIGIAYQNTSLCVFGPTVLNNTGGVNQPTRTKMESTVLEHEFGHLMGLVNLGTPMVTPHNDPANAGHCNNSSCLLYYQANTTEVGGILMNSPVPLLDANCRADLRANGGK